MESLVRWSRLREWGRPRVEQGLESRSDRGGISVFAEVKLGGKVLEDSQTPHRSPGRKETVSHPTAKRPVVGIGKFRKPPAFGIVTPELTDRDQRVHMRCEIKDSIGNTITSRSADDPAVEASDACRLDFQVLQCAL